MLECVRVCYSELDCVIVAQAEPACGPSFLFNYGPDLVYKQTNSRVVKGIALIAEGRGFDSVCLVPKKKIMNSVIV